MERLESSRFSRPEIQFQLNQQLVSKQENHSYFLARESSDFIQKLCEPVELTDETPIEVYEGPVHTEPVENEDLSRQLAIDRERLYPKEKEAPVPEPEPINPILERIHIPNQDEIAKQRRDEAKSKQEEEQYWSERRTSLSSKEYWQERRQAIRESNAKHAAEQPVKPSRWTVASPSKPSRDHEPLPLMD